VFIDNEYYAQLAALGALLPRTLSLVPLKRELFPLQEEFLHDAPGYFYRHPPPPPPRVVPYTQVYYHRSL
jgi:hypothetical protein